MEDKKMIDDLQKLFEKKRHPKIRSSFIERNNYFGNDLKNIISLNFCDLDTLFESYFQEKPPFHGLKRKTEFPDAVALISLEHWAKENNEKILAVSKDNGWIKFAEGSNHIDVFSELNESLNKIQSGLDDIKLHIRRLINEIKDGQNDVLIDHIDKQIYKIVDENDTEIDILDSYVYSSPESFISGYELYDIEYIGKSLDFEDNDIYIINHSKNRTRFYSVCSIEVSGKVLLNLEIDTGESGYFSKPHILQFCPTKVFIGLIFDLKGDLAQTSYIPKISNIAILGDSISISLGHVSIDFED